jgi:nitric oxide reductase subunit C
MMLTDPELVFPGARKMVKYNMSEQDKNDMVAFFKWISEIDTNGFPPKPVNQ